MTVHKTLEGHPATEGPQGLERDKQEILRLENLFNRVEKWFLWVCIIISVFTDVRILSTGFPEDWMDFLLLLLMPSFMFSCFFICKIGFAWRIKGEIKAANRPIKYVKATVTKKSLNFYIEDENEATEAILLEDILNVTYDQETNLLSIEFNCESYDNLSYTAIMEIEDVFLPPLRDSLL